ncbi:MAG TPA: polysaccharide biosynthesis/export family protein [Bryobacteraceae bacterium]|jgi:polysaccharide export outer membrane protein|nr:polysaccharide biosynthesis/export family protein [Bryobacteraceae bacterium]
MTRRAGFLDMLLAAACLAAGAGPAGQYVLGPDDQITIQAPDIEEISGKPVRVDRQGMIHLPLAGAVPAAGLTAAQLQVRLKEAFTKYLRHPDITVAVTEYRSQPVSVLGAVQNPGIHQLQGNKDLLAVLSLAGGLRQDAGATLRITRKLEWGRLPLPAAADDSSGQYSVASLHIRGIMAASSPADNIPILPGDVITVPRADLIYAVGAVRKAGGFVLGEHETISALQAVALAEGLERTAASQNARILRASEGSAARLEIPVDIRKILEGTAADVPLRADDILFVPTSGFKNVALRTFEAAVQIGTGVAIYRH